MLDDSELGSWAPPRADTRRQRMGGTTRDRVARELRNQILLGERAPGERIDLDALAEEFGVSRTPVREACLELAHDKLVRMAPRSGVSVIGVSPLDLLDNFALMAMLAGQAAAWAAARATAENLEVIRQSRDRVQAAVRDGQSPTAANYEFHRQINRASHSPRLIVLISQTARLFPDGYFESIPAQIPCSLDEHAQIVVALENHDSATARQVSTAHFLQAAELLDSHISRARSKSPT